MEEKNNLELKLNLGRREGWVKDVLRFVFISHYPSLASHWQLIKLIFLNQVWFELSILPEPPDILFLHHPDEEGK